MFRTSPNAAQAPLTEVFVHELRCAEELPANEAAELLFPHLALR